MDTVYDRVESKKSEEDHVIGIVDYRHVRAKSDHFYHVSASGSGSSTASDVLLVTLIRRILFPITIVCSLLFFAKLEGDSFSTSYQILAILALLLSTHLFKEVSLYRALKIFPVFVAFGSLLARWFVFISILGLLGYLTGLSVYFTESVLLSWIIFTPVLLLVSQFSRGWLFTTY